ASGENIERWVPLNAVEFVSTPDYCEFFHKHIDPETHYCRQPGSHALAVALHTAFLGASRESQTVFRAWSDLGQTVEQNKGRIDFFTVACSLISMSISEPMLLLPNWLIMSGF